MVDDGIGMSREEARLAYLVVGRKRRVESGEFSPGGRRVHGRKGIGKLAAFGTAGVLECLTVRAGEETSFRLDYDNIRRLTPDEDYPVEAAAETSPLVNPEDDSALTSGTRVSLTRLWLKRALSQQQFMRSMARRFSIASTEMRVVINGEELRRFDMNVEFRFPRDGVPGDSITADADGWAMERLASGDEVRWWIGFTETPLREEYLQGISILANGKMAQRPFKFERAQGTEGQLGQEYLVGEIQADWLDVGTDIEDDLIQSNRDQLQLEDERLADFLTWGRRRLEWALRKRNDLRRDKVLAEFTTSPTIDELLQDFTAAERRPLLRVAATVSRLPEITADGVDELMRSVVPARSDLVVRQLMEQIDAEDDPVQERMWGLVAQFGLIDARKTLSIIEARLETIDRLREALSTGAREVPEIH